MEKDISTLMIPQEKVTAMQCLPDALADREYYRPTGEGREKQVKRKAGQNKKLESTNARIFVKFISQNLRLFNVHFTKTMLVDFPIETVY